MKAGWKTVKLSDVCDIVKGRKPNLRPTPNKGDLPYLVARYIRGLEEPEYGSPTEKGIVTLTEDDTVIICDGSNSGEIFTGLNGIMSSTMGKVVKKTEIHDPYLRHFLASTFELFNGTKTGSAIPHLDKEAFRKLEIPLPPLAEQKRIVALLDEAFAGIDEAKAKAEANLASAQNIFERYLQSIFSQTSPGWSETTIGDQITLQRGFDITKQQQKIGLIPVVSSGGVKSYHDTAMTSGPGVVIGRKGTLGKCFFMESDYWPHDTTLWVKDFKGNDPRFVYYLFVGLDVKKFDSGSANPALNRNQIHPIKLTWPKIEMQRSIAVRLDEIHKEAQGLAKLQTEKSLALSEIKQSLLRQAFAGELTA